MKVLAGFALFHMLCVRDVVAGFAFFHMLGTLTISREIRLTIF